jgi:hypothetical protein
MDLASLETLTAKGLRPPLITGSVITVVPLKPGFCFQSDGSNILADCHAKIVVGIGPSPSFPSFFSIFVPPGLVLLQYSTRLVFVPK